MDTKAIVDALDERLKEVDRVIGVRMAQWIEDSGLDLHQVRLLLAISAHDEPVEIRDLAEEAGLSIDLAYRSVHALDRRRLTRGEHRHHLVTDAGRELVQNYADSRRAATESFIESLSDEERRRLETVLGGG